MNHSIATSRRMRAAIALAASVLLLPVALTACASAPAGDDETTSAGGRNALAACMRDKGYDMTDQSSGGSSSEIAVPDGVDPDAWKRDLASCIGSTGGFEAGEVQQAEEMPGSREKRVEVAECIRDAGFEDYPDDPERAADYRADDEAAFTEAAKACDEQVFGPADGGTSFDGSEVATEGGR